MEKKVEIVSSEMVKPYSSTPETLRIYKLSSKDQAGACGPYTSMILFYATAPPPDFSARLKQSLQLVLNHDCMYPLAGRVKDMYSIECNDEGALFIQARVNEEFSNVVKTPSIDLYLELFPPPPPEVWTNPCDRVLLAVQVSEFVNGGIAISASVSHCITDGAALASFLKNWAEIALACHEGRDCKRGDGFVVDCTAFFPPSELVYVVKDPPIKLDLIGDNTSGNIFTFNASSIATIRDKASNKGERKTTRYEAMSAFLWAAVISAREKSGRSFRVHVNCNALNLRTRLVPPLPQHCLGNISHMTSAVCGGSMEEAVELSVLAEMIRDSLSKVTHEEVVQDHHASREGHKAFMQRLETTSTTTDNGVGVLVMSSFCRFPFYDVDFGWGKPSWVGYDRVRNNFAVFMDTVDGDGIEAWVRLPEEDMKKLEQDVDFLSYVSSIQSL